MSTREEKYQIALDKRVVKYGAKLRGAFNKAKEQIVGEVNALYALNAETGIQAFADRADRKNNTLQRVRAVLFMLGQTEEAQLTAQWGEEYKLSALNHLFFIEQEHKVGVNIPMLNGGSIMAAVQRPWEGRHFSSRIRTRTDLLAAAMEDIITQASIQGWGVTRTAKEIRARCDESWSNAVRLARTEINRAAAQGQSMAYMANDDILGEKEFCATLDTVTSSACRKQDGKTYPLDYDTPDNPGKEGERIPNHPNCRSYWRPVIKSAAIAKLKRERSYRLEEGQRGYTSARTFDEWAKEKGVA